MKISIPWKSIKQVVLIVIITLAGSWGITLGFTKLISLCFNCDWTILTGTGVWLSLLLLVGCVKTNVDIKS